MILVNGSVDGRVSALDRGLAYGDGVFRTMLAQAGRVRCWDLQHAKLAHDCLRIGIDCPPEETLRADVETLLAQQADCVVKIVVTRGQGGRGYAPPSDPVPLRMVASFPLPVFPGDRTRNGVRVRWCQTQVSVQPVLAGIKHLNRLENVMARREWSDDDIAEGLMLDPCGRVIEGTMSNVFILESGRLVTPALTEAGVAGVQRDRLLQLAPRLGLECSIDAITPARLLASEQVYLTNSVIGVWWVSSIDDRDWLVHPITPALVQLLEQRCDD